MLLPMHVHVLDCTPIDPSPPNRHIIFVLVAELLQSIQLLWGKYFWIGVRLGQWRQFEFLELLLMQRYLFLALKATKHHKQSNFSDILS